MPRGEAKNNHCSYNKRETWMPTQTEGHGHATAEAETRGAAASQDGRPARGSRESRDCIFTRASAGVRPCWPLDLGILASRTTRPPISVVLSPQLAVLCYSP